jgi:hypothetical protein
VDYEGPFPKHLGPVLEELTEDRRALIQRGSCRPLSTSQSLPLPLLVLLSGLVLASRRSGLGRQSISALLGRCEQGLEDLL